MGYLKVKNIDKLIKEDLDFQSPKIQFVCHYLKSLADRSIVKKDISEDSTKMEILKKEECIKLLMLKFLENRDPNYTSYTQLGIFVDVLYSLFMSFSKSGFFSYSILSATRNLNEKNAIFIKEDIIARMRLSLVEGLVLAADQFTSKSVENVRNHQKKSMEIAKSQFAERANEALGNAVVTWENTKPFSVVFTSDDSPIFVYKSLNDVPQAVRESLQNQIEALRTCGVVVANPLKDYKSYTQIELFEKLASLTNKLYNRNVCLKCFRKYDKSFEYCFECPQQSLLLNRGNQKAFLEKVALESSKDYALTPDNFIKMLLVFTRVQSRIPVIIMGETGCGKTSMIRYLCSRILDDEFRIFSIHAGINQEIIVQEMNEFIKFSNKLKDDKRKLWVFFDEFNTTSSIGLIKEIICERTMLGKSLPENMAFLGACNPWRLKAKQIIFDENVGIKKNRLNQFNSKYNLLYTVHPLPETIIDYVWDYGHLDTETERKYVDAMFSSLTIAEDAALKEIMISLICVAHQQFRKWEDVSSVSLRDVARYKILFNWFLTSIIERNNLLDKNKNKKSLKVLKYHAAILAFLHCYYLRISSKKKRVELLEKLEPLLRKLLFKDETAEKLLYKEEMDFLRRMKPLPEGIAENHALRENVFALIVCILTKIPIFICGKPGCSKSLAVQLVFNHLRGKNSQDEYFRTLPELIPVSYQGSEYCTSESILGVFNRAEKYLNVNTQNKDILPVIIFDEIGLAEISNNNPLKVLQNKLEIENIKVAFVGISNWRLDASKMNRALYLARPDPDIEDLKFTAKAIYNSIGKRINPNEKIIESLARIYCDLRKFLKEKKKEDIFGLRDYYFLIKGLSSDLIEFEQEDYQIVDQGEKLYQIVRKNLKKNFSGLGNEHEFLWKKFCLYMGVPEKEIQTKEPSVRELILNNLSERNSRYLMLITQSDCVSEYIEEMIRNRENKEEIGMILEEKEDLDHQKLLKGQIKENEGAIKEVKTLVGSYMPDDLTKQTYGFRILSDIILYIEKGYTLIFKNIDHIYSSLYDLFNQSFSWSGDKKYCRVALGALYNPKCLVHQDFHCIIFMNEADVEKADPPFLNRFEKYRLNIDNILSPNEKIIQDQLVNWVYSIVTWSNEPDLISPNLLFVNYNPEYLFSLILKIKRDFAARGEWYDDDKILDVCKKELIKLASFDFCVMVSLNIKNEEMKTKLLELYYQTKAESFRDFCDKILSQKENILKNVVYTYSQISQEIPYSDKTLVTELKLGNFKSEIEIQEEVIKYLNSDKSLLVIRVDLAKESRHLLLIKHILLNCLNTYKYRKGCHLMLIIHLQRYNAGSVSFDTLFHDWQSQMFDSLIDVYMLPIEYLEQPNFSKLKDADLIIKLEDMLEELFAKCLSKFKYNVENAQENRINERRNKILSHLKDEYKDLLKLLKDKIETMISKDRMNLRFGDWRKYIISEEWIRAAATSPIEALNIAMAKYFEDYLLRILYKLEKDYLLDSYINSLKDEFMTKLWLENFNQLVINNDERLGEQILEVNFIFDLNFPFSSFEYPNIQKVQEEVDEIEKEQNEAILDIMTLDKFKEISYFGDEFYNQIFDHPDLFEQYFHDQLLLYLSRNKINISVEIANLIFDHIFLKDPEAKFQYFLTKSNEFNLILRVLEALLTLKDGKNILKISLNGVLNLDEVDIKGVNVKNLPKHLLLFKNGNLYSLTQMQLTELLAERKQVEEYEKDDNSSPFLNLVFKNIIEEISSCEYLSKFNTINEVKSAFKLIEDKIIKTEIFPSNLEAFRPWIDLMQFIEACDKTPSHQFKAIVEWLRPFEEDGLFLVAKTINKLMDHLKTEINFVGHLNRTERERKIIKLQTQLYKNLVSMYDDDFFDQVISVIDKEPELWKTSGKIIDLLDDYTNFSSSIIEFDGNIDYQNNSGLDFLEKILSKVSNKIVLLLGNKAFTTIESYWNDNYREILDKQFENFERNTRNFGKLLGMIPKNQQNKAPPVPFLIVIIWLKTYLYFYSIALEQDDKEIDALKKIDGILCELSPELSTLKLYILKNLKLKHNKNLKDLRKEYAERKVDWIKPLLKENPNKNQNDDLILPLPLYQSKEFKKIDQILNAVYNLDREATNKFVGFCEEAQYNYNLSICIYSWFVRLYTNHLQKNGRMEPEFIELISNNKAQLSKNLGDIGYQFIVNLLVNFTPNSFFHLIEDMNSDQINQRLVALSVVMVFIAQKNSDSAFASFLYKSKEFQTNLSEHFTKIYLFGQLENNFIVNNMKDVKVNIERRMRQNLIPADSMFIYKCSEKCDYLYYFEGCGRPVEKSICKVCGSEIGASSYNVLLHRGNGSEQIRMPIPNGLKYIDDYITKFEKQNKKGYVFNHLEENAKLDTKQHIKPITFRTLHFLLHAAIFGFYEVGILKEQEINKILGPKQNTNKYFEKHFLQDYKMIAELIGNNQQNIWIYQMLSGIEVLSRQKGVVDNSEALIQLEKAFEDQVIFPVIQSVNTVIQKYHQSYVEYNKFMTEEEDILVYVDELKLNPEKFPYLEFYNYMNFPSFEDFSNRFALLVSDGKNFPLLDLVLKRHREFSAISCLPKIVEFTNYLMKKFNYRISRDEATTTKIIDLFVEDDFIKKKFPEFEEKWNNMSLQTVRVQCQQKEFQKINADHNLSLFLPNTHKDESGILLVGTMIALAILQNEFIYTAKKASNPEKSLETIIKEEKMNMDIIQTITSDHVIHINRDLIMVDIVKSGYIHNYEYGKSREIIYDFEEIESKLFQYVNGKKILNEEKLILMNYQFELYPESSSIFTDIRKKNPQESLTPEDKAKYRNLLKQFSKKDLLAYLGSLDYVFTYLRNLKEEGRRSIEDFTKACIQNYQHLNEHVIKRQPFSTVPLKNIVDLYETLEEVIFDQAIEDFIRPEFLEKIPEDEKKQVIEMFTQATLRSPNKMLYPKLREADTLAKVFKRLILRVLLAQVNLENRLFDYFAREDMWEQDIDINEIYNLELKENIKLKHSYIILKDLEAQVMKFEPVQNPIEINKTLDRHPSDDYHKANKVILKPPTKGNSGPEGKKRNTKKV